MAAIVLFGKPSQGLPMKVAMTTIDGLIERARLRADVQESKLPALLRDPRQHRRAVELMLLYRDCLFELEETRRLIARVSPATVGGDGGCKD